MFNFILDPEIEQIGEKYLFLLIGLFWRKMKSNFEEKFY
jgi:hypothetical protein